jgi:hypothetical protein
VILGSNFEDLVVSGLDRRDIHIQTSPVFGVCNLSMTSPGNYVYGPREKNQVPNIFRVSFNNETSRYDVSLYEALFLFVELPRLIDTTPDFCIYGSRGAREESYGFNFLLLYIVILAPNRA